MSTLIVTELVDELTHEAITTERLVVTAVRPILYKHLSPAGTFTMELIQNGETIGSKSLTCAEMETESDQIEATNYFHGPVRFLFDSPLVVNPGQFDIKLTASGYTFTESAWIGWIQPYDQTTTNNFESTGSDLNNPYGLEIWTYKEV